METFFMQTPMGQYLAQKEADFFRRHLQYLNGQVTVQLGGIWQRPSENIKLLFRSTNFFQSILQNSNFLGRSSPIQSIPPVIYWFNK